MKESEVNIIRVKFKSDNGNQHADMIIPETDLEAALKMILNNIKTDRKTTITVEPVGTMVDYYIAPKYQEKKVL